MNYTLISLLVTSFLVSPLQPVFAREAAVGTQKLESLVTIVAPEVTPKQETKPEVIDPQVIPVTEVLPEQEIEKPEEPVIESSPGGLDPDGDLSKNPNVYSAATVEPFSGGLSYSLEMKIPPGRNGMQPQVALTYSSQSKQVDSIVGYGWSLSIPYIERINKTGINDMYSSFFLRLRWTENFPQPLIPARILQKLTKEILEHTR